MRAALNQWMEDTGDLGLVPEDALIERFWPGRQQPVTEAPVVRFEEGRVVMVSATEGASIGYRLSADEVPGIGWRIYQEPLELPAETNIRVIAHRLGYAPSDIVESTLAACRT